MSRHCWLATALVVFITLQADALAAAAGHQAAAPRVVPVHVLWLHLDPLMPRSLYAGGVLFCSDPTQSCYPWLMHSTDGGENWSDLSISLASAVGRANIAPLQVATDGQHMYHVTSFTGPTPASAVSYVVQSTDGGLHWAMIGDLNPGQYGDGFREVVLSPVSAQRLYANDGGTWQTSGDAGHRWMPCADAATSLVADPARLATVYGISARGDVTSLLRSDDACARWSTPRPTPARDFTLAVDPHEGTALVGLSNDPRTPGDRRYLSDDGGRTWRIVSCPGDLNGTCPAFTVDGVFGAGASYGFVNDGIYRFVAGGPALVRLAISDRLPAPTAAILAVAAGTQPGDPLFLLTKGQHGNEHGLLYRSSDAGRTWRRLVVRVLPNLTPPSTAPGGLFVAQTNHTVAEPFVARYHTMSPYVLGHPLTEAFMEGTALTQVFDHLILELHGSQVVVARLPQAIGLCHVFISAIRPDMQRFWQRHGGLAVFGAPLAAPPQAGDCSHSNDGGTEVYTSNGDGSGRRYAMQWFENARLERHPEIANPRFGILLSLAGRDALKALGWLP